MRYINHFFWWCAGANIEVLEESPTDQAKYFGVGGTIVFTALMASFAGGYAFFTAFKSVLPSLFFGAFWGLLIFNLDRYIVSTIGRGDGTQKITLQEWKLAAPRLIMAILLGFVISTPLELKIFETEIQTVVERLKIDKSEELKNRDTTFIAGLNALKARRAQVESDVNKLTYDKVSLSENAGNFFENTIREKKQDLSNKQKLQEALQKKVNAAYSSYISAKRDSLSSKEVAERLRILRIRQSDRDNVRKEIKVIQQEIEDLNDNKGKAIVEEKNRINELLANKQQEKESLDEMILSKQKTLDKKNEGYEIKTENYNGFAAHLEAMSILTDEKPAIFWAKWLITLLFIFIEVAPVLFKLMAEAGPYDEYMDRVKHEAYVRERKKISDVNDEINTSLKITSERNLSRLNSEIASNQALIDEITKAQAEIATLAVKKWKEQEKSKLEVGVDHIIKRSQQ